VYPRTALAKLEERACCSVERVAAACLSRRDELRRLAEDLVAAAFEACAEHRARGKKFTPTTP
jgi:hypothetical protein